MKFNLDKLLIASGFIGPALFFLVIYILLPFFYPGYSIANQTISELGVPQSPVRFAANVFGFSLCGILTMLFAFGLFRVKENMVVKISSFFFFLTGLLMYLVGIFYSKSEFSILATLHVIVANYQFPILALALVIFAFGVAGHERLRWLTPAILVFGLITLSIAYFFFFVHDLAYRGIVQRFAIGIPYLLMMLIAATLYKVEFSNVRKI